MKKADKNKFYFFRELESGPNLLDGKEFHAAGLVSEIINEEETKSGKDFYIEYINPFDMYVNVIASTYSEVELYEVSGEEHAEIAKKINKIDSLDL